jgi:hypothetical protein
MISIYHPQMGHGREHGDGLVASLRSLGQEVRACASEYANAADPVHDLTGLIVYGLRGGARRLADAALDAGAPVCVLELGYIADRSAFLGVSRLTPARRYHNRNGYLLSGPDAIQRPADRLQALGVEALPGKQPADQPKGKKGQRSPVSDAPRTALILGQVPGDSQLGGEDPAAWGEEWTASLRSQGWTVDLRPHPDVKAATRPLDADIRAHDLCLSFNSTSLVRCIELGIPFLCHESCQYHAMSGQAGKPQAERQQFLQNLAYCQYQVEEFADGTVARYIMQLFADPR